MIADIKSETVANDANLHVNDDQNYLSDEVKEQQKMNPRQYTFEENYNTNTKSSDYNDHEDILLLGDGFHSQTEQSKFKTRYRVLIYFVVFGGLSAANFLYFANIPLCVWNIIIHLCFLIGAGCIELYNQKNNSSDQVKELNTQIKSKITYHKRRNSSLSPTVVQQKVHKLSIPELQLNSANEHFEHSYTNAMNWLFGVSNTFRTVPTWLSWWLPGGLLYTEIILLCILKEWGTDIAPGQYCKNGYPIDLDNEPDIKTGGCFIEQEISLLFGVEIMLGIIITLGTLWDISPESWKELELTKKRIKRLFKEDPFGKEYFLKLNLNKPAKRKVRPLICYPLNPTAIVSSCLILLPIFAWSLHLIWWERILLFQISSTHNTMAIVLYVFVVVGFFCCSIVIIQSMHTNKSIYYDYWMIMQRFSEPLRINSLEDIRMWSETRKLYMNYYMVIYFGLSNGVVVSYVVVELSAVFIAIYWTFFTSSDHTFQFIEFTVASLGVAVIAVVFIVYILWIFAMAADISSIKQKHVSMFHQEKQRIKWKMLMANQQIEAPPSRLAYEKKKDNVHTWNQILEAIDDTCEMVNNHDKSPKIVGIKMTWTLYNVMLGYFVTGLVSVVSATLFSVDENEK